MSITFGIYSSAPPQPPRLVITAGYYSAYAFSDEQIPSAFSAIHTALDRATRIAHGWPVSAVPHKQNHRSTQRANLSASRGPVVARVVRHRQRGASARVAQ